MADDKDGTAREGASAWAWKRGLASLGALVVAALLIWLVVLAQISNRERDDALTRERQSYDILVLSRALDASMAKAEAALGRFVISGDRQTGALYYDEWLSAGHMLRQLRRMTRDDAVQQPLMTELAALYTVRGQELSQPATHATYRQGWPALSLFNLAGEKPSVDAIARVLDRIGDTERQRLAQLSDAAAHSVTRSNRLATILSGLGVMLVLAAILLGWLTVQAWAEQKVAYDLADEESDRAGSLEQAVTARTQELSLANEALREEAETRAQAEAQLRQIQKMEAVGQLTGGIAHDFNNMLAVVVGGLDLARRRLDQERAELDRHLDSALDGANRAAALTRRLLAFARSEPLLPEAVDPATLVANMSELLDRTLGERIVVATQLPQGGWPVYVDPHQLENAIVNLAVNARDAMDGEGQLIVAIANVALGVGAVGQAPAGDYVRIDVTDTGCGMSAATLERAFEPFFTTKPVGRGTGLGLSQVFGFTRQSGGDVAIRSGHGEGTTVSLHLPRHHQRATSPLRSAAETVVPINALTSDPATILVVEDDYRVRAATVEALEELGHEVLPCGSGEEALHLLARRADIQLVVTDVIMPGMTGPELIERVARLRPGIGVLFVTGFVGEAGDAERFRGHDVLRKPFTIAGLESAVGGALFKARRAPERAA